MAGTSNKIFVGGLPQSCENEGLSDYFGSYGRVLDAVVMKDRDTSRSRGFGFVTFETTQAVDMVMEQYNDHKITDKWVEVKRAVPQGKAPPPTVPAGGKGGNRDRGSNQGAPASSGGASGPGPNDWTCPNCRSNNFGNRETCFKCGVPKPVSTPASYAAVPAAYGAYGNYPGYAAYTSYGAYPGCGGGYAQYPNYAQYPGYAQHPGYAQYAQQYAQQYATQAAYAMPAGYGVAAPPGAEPAKASTPY
eukprot:TRINITY_DN26522_c0_g1_i1.p2 TRINITY_DN26522_c0_g1~~TRINITY_DN26522_c0_g1_i1.p2  ORF type:complete len:247 (+),score=10.18 TRINITY_DN26522_c0_g1_i1:87-827(+)